MSTRRVGRIGFAAIGIWALTCAVAVPQSLSAGQTVTNPLVGVWRFASEVDTRADGSVIATVTSKEKHGYIVYTADKFVSAIIMPTKRSWVLDSATREQLATSADDGTAYAGSYSIDKRTQTVTHILGVSFEPAYESRHLTRKYVLRGNSLALSGTYSSKGENLKFTVHLSRSLANRGGF